MAVRMTDNRHLYVLKGLVITSLIYASVAAIYGQTRQVFTSSGTFTVPDGVTTIIVECWGAGGAGGGTGINNARGGGGGAGGAYARKTLSVSPGEMYTVSVGGVTLGTLSAGATGSPSWFGSPSLVYAEGGAGGAAPNGGTAPGGTGSAANSIGDVVFPGGNGANGTATYSGGGGGGAGSGGAGGNASGTTGGAGTAEEGGNGAAGLTAGGNGLAGYNYGGGGSGAYVNNNTNRTGGNGAQGLVIVSWTPSQIFTSSGTFTVPAGVTSITVECWGGGGAGGGNNTNSDGGGGGGGGAYARRTLTVVPGTVYSFVVGAGGTGVAGGNGNPGGDTWFGSVSTVLAKGGGGGYAASGGTPGAGGAGGSAASSIGDVVYSGGNGGRGRDHNKGFGGPGGSSAGTSSNGVSGPDPWTTVVASNPPPGGGKGGNGGMERQNGLPGLLPGGGGGGSGDGTNKTGGNGAGGQIVISYSPPVFYSQSSGDPAVLSNWKTLDGYSPADFTTPGQQFVIQNGHTMTTTASGWSVSGSRTMIKIFNGGVLTEIYPVSISSNCDLVIQDGGTLNHNVNSLTIFGGGKFFDNNSTVNYGLNGAQTVADATYGNLILSGSGVKSITSATVNGTLSMEGTATASAQPVYGPNAALQYKGTTAQSTGPEFPSTFSSSGGIIINNSNGVTLNGNRTITTSLNFINGKINTGSYILTIDTDAKIFNAGDGKYINGNLRINIDEGTTQKTFEIGDASNYTPVTISFAGTTNGTGNIVAYTTPGDHPDIGTSSISPDYTVNRYWTLINNGVSGFTSYDVTFNFVSGDMFPGTNYQYFTTACYNSGIWYYPVAGTRTPTSTQVTGLTIFGDFQIGYVLTAFRSASSGNWEQNTTWEAYLGGTWTSSPVSPASNSGAVTVRSGNTVTIGSPVTIDELTIDTGGTLVINAGVTLDDGPGNDMIVNGTLNCSGTNIISGSGSFVLSPSATLIIGSPEGISSSGFSGNIQTASRTFSTDASYVYAGSSAQITGDGLPSVVRDLTIDNLSGVTLSKTVTLNGTLYLTAGELTTGSNDLIFQNADIPILRTSGTITISQQASLAFGSPGNTGGAAFTIPSGTFTSDPVLNNLTIYRANGITLNDQVMSVAGIVLCNGPLNTNDRLVLLSTDTQTALIDGSGTGQITGNVTMQRYLPSGFGYKYFSSPFQAATVGEFGDDMNLGAPFPSFYRYDESRTTSGWVSYTNSSNILNPLEGYSVHFGSGGGPVTVDITGTVNNGPISRTLYNHNNTYTKGFNLVGNPYPSPIDWDAPSGWTKDNIDDALYFFKASGTDEYGGTYSTYINGVSSDGVVSNIIPSMQGFFVHVSDGAYPVTGTLGLDNSVRINNLTHPFTKSDGTKSLQLVRLAVKFSDDPASEDPAVIYFDSKATESMDGTLDALKLMNTDLNVPNLYSVSSDARKLSINALPYITSTPYQVPLGVKTYRNGTLVFSIKSIDESIASSGIYLYDAVTGINQDLLNGNTYSITLSAAEYLNRFYLTFGEIPTSIELPEIRTSVNIYETKGMLRVETEFMTQGDAVLTLYSITGQPLVRKNFSVPGIYEFNPGLNPGIYIAELKSNRERYTIKIIIRGE